MSENLILETGISNESNQKEGDKMEVISDEVAKAKEVVQEDKLIESGPSENSTSGHSGVPSSDDPNPADSSTQSSNLDNLSDSPQPDQQKSRTEDDPKSKTPEPKDVNEIKSTITAEDPVDHDTPTKTSDTDTPTNKICDVGQITKQEVNTDVVISKSEQEPGMSI